RPIQSSLLPNLQLEIEMPQLQILLTEDQARLVSGIFAGNLSELPSVSEADLGLLTHRLTVRPKSETEKIFVSPLPPSMSPQPAATLPTIPPENNQETLSIPSDVRSTSRMIFRIEMISLQVSRGSGFDIEKNSAELLEFRIKHFELALDTKSD